MSNPTGSPARAGQRTPQAAVTTQRAPSVVTREDGTTSPERQVRTVLELLENRVLTRAGMEDRIDWNPEELEEHVRQAIERLLR